MLIVLGLKKSPMSERHLLHLARRLLRIVGEKKMTVRIYDSQTDDCPSNVTPGSGLGSHLENLGTHSSAMCENR